ncbi:MAG: DUF305 domain-containing protein [Granulosicoccus sp.]
MKTNRRQFLTASTLIPASVMVGSVVAAESEPAGDADIGFCQDMSVHHLQALAMCQRVLGRDTGDSVQAAAAEVLQNQAIEVGQMRAWLTDWGASTVPPERVMAWMGANRGTGMPIGMMPGYASEEQLAELSTLEGRSRGRRWLELMRAHHEGGVMMADQAQNLASSAKVVRLAKFQVNAQSYEISIYDMLLAQTYALD